MRNSRHEQPLRGCREVHHTDGIWTTAFLATTDYSFSLATNIAGITYTTPTVTPTPPPNLNHATGRSRSGVATLLRLVLLLAIYLAAQPSRAAVEVMNFNQFTVETHLNGTGFDVPLWQISPDGRLASETRNSFSTFLVSPTSFIDKTIRGYITPDSDDDLIGIAIGFQPGDASSDAADYLLISWKGITQTFDYLGGNNSSSPGGVCPIGLAISRVRGIPNHDELWQRADLAGTAGGVTPIARGATLGSTAYDRAGGSHYFKIEYTSAAVRVYVDDVLQFNVAGSFVPARFAVWEQSQSPGGSYFNFSVSELSDPDPEPPNPPSDKIPDGAWSIVVLPDTQYYSQNSPGIFYSQTSWIIENLRKRNIRYVIGLGDITNTNAVAQWEAARSAVNIMHGRVPYALVTGNHDYGPGGNATTRDTLANQYFPYARYAAMPTFGGSKDPDNVENMYHLFEAGGVKWIIICLEWAPRDAAITWASFILQQYPDRKAILVSHAIMNNNDLRYDITDTVNLQEYNPHLYSTPGPVNDGEELWQKLTRRFNFVLTLSGHVLGDGTGFRQDNNDLGFPVSQMLINYQFRTLGGEGYLRILEFQPDGHTVKALSYSTIYNTFLMAPDQNFQFDMPLGAKDSDADGTLDYFDSSFDDDLDGLNNYQEFVVYGTDIARKDTDGDGAEDNVEVKAGTNPLFNDRPALRLVMDAPQNFGLYSESMLRELYLGDLLISRGPSGFRLDLQLEGNTQPGGGPWQPAGPPIQWLAPPPDSDAYFYRVRASRP